MSLTTFSPSLKEKRFLPVTGFHILMKSLWIHATKEEIQTEVNTVLKPALKAYVQELTDAVQVIADSNESKAGLVKLYDAKNQNEEADKVALNIDIAKDLFLVRQNYQNFQEESRTKSTQKTTQEACQEKLTSAMEICTRI